MGSLVRRIRKVKRCLGEVRVLGREEYQELELSAKVEMIRSLIPLGLMHVQALLQEELEALAGPRHAREDGGGGAVLRSGAGKCGQPPRDRDRDRPGWGRLPGGRLSGPQRAGPGGLRHPGPRGSLLLPGRVP